MAKEIEYYTNMDVWTFFSPIYGSMSCPQLLQNDLGDFDKTCTRGHPS